MDFEPTWEDGCGNWESVVETRWNENMDTFLHGLRAAHADLCLKNDLGKGKGKGKERAGGYEHVRLVIVVERAERLKDSLPELLVPLTRLAELVSLDSFNFALFAYFFVVTARLECYIYIPGWMGGH